MNLDFLNVLSKTASKPLGTSGTSQNDAGFCVPIANPTAGNTGNKTRDEEKILRDVPTCSQPVPASWEQN
jgi:hypothetical protein